MGKTTPMERLVRTLLVFITPLLHHSITPGHFSRLSAV
jgi:hypothetical protein